MGDKISELENILRNRLVKPDKYPPFYKFEKIDEELIGTITAIRKIERDGKEDIIYVLKTKNGKEWSIPSYKVLSRLMTEQNVKQGDYVLIKYEGETKSKRGRPAKLFSLGKVAKEELESSSVSQNDDLDKAIDFIKKLFDFYPEGMDKDDLQKRLQARGLNVSIDEVTEAIGLKIEDNKVKKG